MTTSARTRTVRRAGSGSVDLVRVYLEQVGQEPLLRPEQEADLAKRVHAGRSAAVVERRTQALDDLQRRTLAAIVADGARARQRMITANLRLVVATAVRHHPARVELLDLVQEGNVGLVRAVDRFEASRGYRFSTYATWWIRQALHQSRRLGHPLHVPAHAFRLDADIQTATQRLEQRLRREPTDAEIAAELRVDADRLVLARRACAPTASLDREVGADKATVLGAFVADLDAADPAEEAVRAAIPREVGRAVARLSPRERHALGLRYGLAPGRPRRYRDVARELGLSGETARQIELRALAELRRVLDEPPRGTAGLAARRGARVGGASQATAGAMAPAGVPPPAAQAQPAVHVLTGGGAGRVLVVDGAVTVGRRGTCTLVLDDPRVSRIHARLTRIDGAVVLEDLGSRNGTALNHRLVRGPRTLEDADLVAFGPVVCRFRDARGRSSTTLVHDAPSSASRSTKP